MRVIEKNREFSYEWCGGLCIQIQWPAIDGFVTDCEFGFLLWNEKKSHWATFSIGILTSSGWIDMQ